MTAKYFHVRALKCYIRVVAEITSKYGSKEAGSDCSVWCWWDTYSSKKGFYFHIYAFAPVQYLNYVREHVKLIWKAILNSELTQSALCKTFFLVETKTKDLLQSNIYWMRGHFFFATSHSWWMCFISIAFFVSYYHHQSLVLTMLESHEWIMFLHSDLYLAKSLDRLHFFGSVVTTFIHILFDLALLLGGPLTYIEKLFNLLLLHISFNLFCSIAR